MILSEADKTVVWELNELLAADRRAKAFSEASIGGEYASRSSGFEEAHWQTIGGDADTDDVPTETEEPPAGEDPWWVRTWSAWQDLCKDRQNKGA